MKKLLIILLLSTSFSTFANDHLDSLVDGFCYKSPKIQVRNGLFFLPNQTLPYSGESLCVYSRNSQYHSQGEIIKGKPEGWWTWWKENGELLKKEEFKDGKKTGYKKTDFTFNENGQLVAERIYKDGNSLGITKYDENGQKESEGNYINGKKNGNWTFWHENGQKESEGNYINGKKNGNWTYWNEKGQIYREKNYKDGKKDGGQTFWSNSSDPSYVWSVGNYKDGKLDGKSSSWHKNGKMRSEHNYTDGKLDGKFTYWHKNGQKELERNFKDAIRIGKVTEWNENGKKRWEGNYSNGIPNGNWTSWGKNALEENFKNGTGKFILFSNGKKIDELIYKDGRGLETIWGENGLIESQTTYNNGMKNGPFTSWWNYFNSHYLWIEGNYRDGSYDGKWTYWNEKGQIDREEIYKNGECISGDCPD